MQTFFVAPHFEADATILTAVHFGSVPVILVFCYIVSTIATSTKSSVPKFFSTFKVVSLDKGKVIYFDILGPQQNLASDFLAEPTSMTWTHLQRIA